MCQCMSRGCQGVTCHQSGRCTSPPSNAMHSLWYARARGPGLASRHSLPGPPPPIGEGHTAPSARSVTPGAHTPAGHGLPPPLGAPSHGNVLPSPMEHTHCPVVGQHVCPSKQSGLPNSPGSWAGSQHLGSAQRRRGGGGPDVGTATKANGQNERGHREEKGLKGPADSTMAIPSHPPPEPGQPSIHPSVPPPPLSSCYSLVSSAPNACEVLLPPLIVVLGKIMHWKSVRGAFDTSHRVFWVVSCPEYAIHLPLCHAHMPIIWRVLQPPTPPSHQRST